MEVKNKMIESSVSTRGQLVIPYKLRKKYGIKPNSVMKWIDTGQCLILIPQGDDPVASSRGMLKGTKVSTQSLLKSKKEDKALENK
jgi:bifunctional DNA-binding transcriptional regulator/antitoxin component of YhaV-PrlF toxin-antitoxin module